MVRLLVRAAVFLGSAAIGLLVATFVVDEMTVGWPSFLVVVVIFAVLQSVLAPFIVRTTSRHASALIGASGLLSTFLALLVTSWVTDLRIDGGAGPWLVASVVVWLVTMVAALVLPALVVSRAVRGVRGEGDRSVG